MSGTQTVGSGVQTEWLKKQAGRQTHALALGTPGLSSTAATHCVHESSAGVNRQ